MKGTFGVLKLALLSAAASVALLSCFAAPSGPTEGSGLSAAWIRSEKPFPDPPKSAPPAAGDPQTAVFAGGCFWGIQGVFERLLGVESTTAGYSGGSAATAHYEMVSTGTTGQAESVKIVFNPKVISYGELLKVFFSVAMNPTELDYQGPDQGTQYRSVIFYTSEAQKQIAEQYIKRLTADKVYSAPIVTQVVPLKAFYRAEQYHQHFLDRHPDYPYIVMWDLPKIANLNKLYPDLVNKAYKPA